MMQLDTNLLVSKAEAQIFRYDASETPSAAAETVALPKTLSRVTFA
jgi:hypothetical protein